MFKSLDIQKDMEVVGLDGNHGGREHLISIDWVAYVDQKVDLKKSSANATSQWQAAA
jgi:hypothetical protein